MGQSFVKRMHAIPLPVVYSLLVFFFFFPYSLAF